jgi:hypothetical protein
MQNDEVSGAAGGDGRAEGGRTMQPSSALAMERLEEEEESVVLTQEAGTETQTPQPHT